MMQNGYSNIHNNRLYTMDGYIDLASSVDADTTTIGESEASPSEPSSADMGASAPNVPSDSSFETVIPSVSETALDSGSESMPSTEMDNTEIVTESITEESTEELSTSEDSVSSNEILVSGGSISVENAVDYTAILSEISSDIKLLTVEEPKFFDKKLDDFTVTEGLLLLCFVLLLVGVFGKILRGGEKHV